MTSSVLHQRAISLMERLGFDEISRQEAKKMFDIAWPVWLTYSLQYCFYFITVAIVGHLGPQALAATALGIFFANFTGFSIGYGATTAADTLGSQAFGAGNVRRVGHITQRAVIIMTLAIIPIAVLWWFCEPLLLHMGQDAATARDAAVVVRFLLPSLWPGCMNYVLDKHFHTVGCTTPPLVIVALMVGVNAATCSLLVYSFDIGFIAAPISTSLCSWLQFALVYIYLRHPIAIHRGLDRARAALASLRCRCRRGPRHEERMRLITSPARPTRSASDHHEPPAAEVIPPHDAVDTTSGVHHTTDHIDMYHNPLAQKYRSDIHGGEAAAAASLKLAAFPASQMPTVGGGQNDHNDHTETIAAANIIPTSSSTVDYNTLLRNVQIDEFGMAQLHQLEKLPIPVILALTWPSWSWVTCFQGWREYIVLAVPGAVNATMEWGMSEAQTAVAGMISVYAQAAQTVLSSFGGMLVMGPFSLSIAAAVRVGHHIGDGDVRRAQLAAKTIAKMVAIYVAINVVIILATRDSWIRLFTSDPTVVAIATATQPMLVLYNAFDAAQASLGGVLRGLGYQSFAATANFIGFACLGVPLSVAFALYADIGLFGVWIGAGLAVITGSTLMAIALARVNWQTAANAAQTQARQSDQRTALIPPTPSPMETMDVSSSSEAHRSRPPANGMRRRSVHLERGFSAISVGADKESEVEMIVLQQTDIDTRSLPTLV